MKLTSQKIAALLAIFAMSFPSQIVGQNPPAETYQPGYWQPVDRFNTKSSVEVQLINQTEIPLEYDLTDLESINPQPLKPGEMGTLKNFGDSAYIVVYPTISVDPNEPLTLRFQVSVAEGNKVMVTIKKEEVRKSDPNFFGHRAINLQKNGGIYLY